MATPYENWLFSNTVMKNWDEHKAITCWLTCWLLKLISIHGLLCVDNDTLFFLNTHNSSLSYTNSEV